jgi:hypothetical protein
VTRRGDEVKPNEARSDEGDEKKNKTKTNSL